MTYGYANILVKPETKKKLLGKKLDMQAKLGRAITWDEFLLMGDKDEK